jgi:hypothetical protein
MVHGPLLNDDRAGKGVFADVVFLEQLLELQFFLKFTRGVVAGLDVDGVGGEDAERRQKERGENEDDQHGSRARPHRLHSSIIFTKSLNK